MRNLKRALSLALASVMVLGLMIVGSSAVGSDFADASEIEYKEGVEVMTAIGVIDGVEDGTNFDPHGTLTREQAAKIIAAMLLGPENVDKIGANDTIFVDVAKGSWASGYISYCTGIGIIAGDGQGHFYPTQELTGVAFGKMLLMALGYDDEIEGYVNTPAWAVNVASDMVDAGIDVEGVTFSEPLTREQATQMAYQTLTADMVRYTDKGFTYGDLTVGASDAVAQANEKSKDYRLATADRDEKLQFCEKYFDDLKLNTAATDDFARPADMWRLKSNEIGTYADEADASYTVATEVKTIYADLGLTKSALISSQTEDGATAGSGDGSVNPKSVNTLTRNDTSKLGGRGVLTEVYYDADKNTAKVVYINTYVGKVSNTYPNADEPYIQINALSTGAPAGNYETKGFAKDDIVLYTYADNEVQSVILAEKLENQKVTGFTGSEKTPTKINADGTSYEASRMSRMNSDLVADSSYDLYLDAYGNVIYTTLYEGGIGNYAYVVDVGTNSATAFKTEYYARLLFADGTTQDVVTNKNYTSENGGKDGDKSAKDTIVAYTVNDDDEYVLTWKADAVSETVTMEPGKAYVTVSGTKNSFYTDSGTVFVVGIPKASEEDHVELDSSKAYTGVANAPKISGKPVTHIAKFAVSGSVADYVFIIAPDSVVSTGTDEMIFVKGDPDAKEVTEGSSKYYTYTAYKDGEKIDLKVNSDVTDRAKILKDDTFLKSVSYSNKGYVTSMTPYETTATKDSPNEDIIYAISGKQDTKTEITFQAGTWSEDGGNVGLGYDDAVYYTAKDTIVYTVDGSNVSVGDAGSVGTDSNDTYVAVIEDGALKALAIRKVGANAPASVTLATKDGKTDLSLKNVATVEAELVATTSSTDGGTITYTWTTSGGTLANTSTGTSGSNKVTFSAVGAYEIIVTAKNTISDGSSAEAQARITINVTE